MQNKLDFIPENYKDIMHQVFDQSSQGFQVISSDWQYLYVNKAVADQGKKNIEQLVGNKMMEVYPGIESTQLFKEMKRSMDEKVSIRMENHFEYPDGTDGWFQLFIHPWYGGIIIFSVDITQRKNEEHKLISMISDLNKKVSEGKEIKNSINELLSAMTKLSSSESKEI